MLTLALLSLFLPLACFALLALVWPVRRSGQAAGVISATVATASFVFAAVILVQMLMGAAPVEAKLPWLVMDGQVIAELGIHIDGISASMLAVVTLVAACVQIYSLGYMADEPANDQGRYFTWHSLFIPAMGGLVVAPNLLQLFICWELVGLCSYLLIGYYWKKSSAGKAAVKAFWVTKFADMGLMLGIIALFVETGSFEWTGTPPGIWATVVPALLFIGVMGKSAQVPLHIWLPNAMEGPTPVSALLHAATMVAAGVFLVVRAYPLFAAAPDLLLFMAWLGSITALVAAITAMVQDDIKKVLAYSTCSQLGYMVAALGTGTWMGGYFHLTTHAFFKALLFLGAGAAIHAVHSNSIHDMGGLLKKTKVSGALFVIGSAALMGLPVFAGFFSKDLVLEEMFHAHLYGPLALLLVAVFLTALYMTRVLAIAYFGEASERTKRAHEAPATMLAPMIALGILAVGGGFLGGTFAGLWGTDYHFAVTPVGIAATVLALSGITVGILRYGTKTWTSMSMDRVRTLILGGPIDAFWDAAYRKGLLQVSLALGWFDRYVMDGFINLTGWVALVGANRVRRLQTGKVQDYVFAVVIGVLVFVVYGVLGDSL